MAAGTDTNATSGLRRRRAKVRPERTAEIRRPKTTLMAHLTPEIRGAKSVRFWFPLIE
jgi:hypothetical protein